MSPRPDRRQRLLSMIDHCRTAPRCREELVALLHVADKTIRNDLRWLQQRFPRQFLEDRDQDRRKRWHWPGPAPHLIAEPPRWLSDEELLALVAARGLLRDPRGHGAERRDEPYPGLLDGSLHGLLHRLGLAEAAADLAPEAIQVSRFAARAEDPATLEETFRALLHGLSLRFVYRNNRNEVHDTHSRPLRLINIAGEWHCIAWAPDDGAPGGGCLKQYRVSRMQTAGRTAEPPPRCPSYIPQRQIDERFDEAFRATGSEDPGKRDRVVLAVSPQALPHIEGRTWGGGQLLQAESDLPDGWQRLRFSTTGLEECRHWVLGFGTTVRAERPDKLVRWLRQQAAGLLEVLTESRGDGGKPRCQDGGL